MSDRSSEPGGSLDIEYAFRQREIAIKEREQASRESEIKLKQEELRRSRWLSPLVLALIAATVAALGNAGVAWYNARAQLELEKGRAEDARILEVVRTNDLDKARTNLNFLTSTGLISDKEGKIGKALAEGKVITLPAATPTAQPAEYTIFNNWNPLATNLGAAASTCFTIFQQHHVTSIFTYHLAKRDGSLRLARERDNDGEAREYGPWPVSVIPGQDGFVAWAIKADIDLPKGTYRVIDSDPASWAYNRASSEGQPSPCTQAPRDGEVTRIGFLKLKGYPVGSPGF